MSFLESTGIWEGCYEIQNKAWFSQLGLAELGNMTTSSELALAARLASCDCRWNLGCAEVKNYIFPDGWMDGWMDGWSDS